MEKDCDSRGFSLRIADRKRKTNLLRIPFQQTTRIHSAPLSSYERRRSVREYVEKMLYAKVESKAIDASGIPLYLRGCTLWSSGPSSGRRAGGQAVDGKSVKKHRNDVCRLAMLLAGGEHPAMSKGIRADMQRFMEAYESDPVDPKALKIKGVGAQQVVEVTGTSTCSKAVPDCIPPKAGRSTLTVKLHRP